MPAELPAELKEILDEYWPINTAAQIDRSAEVCGVHRSTVACSPKDRKSDAVRRPLMSRKDDLIAALERQPNIFWALLALAIMGMLLDIFGGH